MKMELPRRIAVAVVAMALGVAGAESSALAQPVPPGHVARPVHAAVPSSAAAVSSQPRPTGARVPEDLLHPRPGEHVAKDRQGRVLLYVEGRDMGALRAAVARAGGVVSAAEPGRVRAAIPQAKIADLNGQRGVSEVRRPIAVVPTGVTPRRHAGSSRKPASPSPRAATPGPGSARPGASASTTPRAGGGASHSPSTRSVGAAPARAAASAVSTGDDPEGVAASGADKWIAAGYTGSGVKVGIIDTGFGDLAASVAAGDLPSGSQVTVNNSTCADAAAASNPEGTSAAEVVHAMAPSAYLYLACASDDMGFDSAVSWLQGQGVQVISSEVSVPGSGRGDGTGAAGSAAQVVQASSKAGVFWATAAGNYQELHYGGTVRTGPKGFVPFNQTGTATNDHFSLGPGGQATVTLRWDAWPKTNTELDLYVMDGSSPPTGPADPNIVASGIVPISSEQGGGAPVQEAQFTNTDSGATHDYYVYVQNVNASYTMPLDVFVSGGAGPLAYWTAAGSVTEPATSPYVTAAGATQPGSGIVESYSSQGPTIDGSVKPDVTGYDQVSTYSFPGGGFGGTAAAAAHVAGAAALLKGVNGQLDQAQLYALLRSRATVVKPGSAAASMWGAGMLNMGTPGSAPSPPGNGYTPLPDPKRILGTADNIGGFNAPLTAGQTIVMPVPGVPTDTTAVAVTITASSANATPATVEVGPQGANPLDARPTNLRVPPGAAGASVTAIVEVSPDNTNRIAITNTAGSTNVAIDLLGYFNPGGANTYFPVAQPVRVLDTRGPNDGTPATPYTGHLATGQVDSVKVTPQSGGGGGPVPSTAAAAVVNVTAVEATSGNAGLAVYASGPSTPTQTVALGENQRASNLAIVPLASDGSGTIKVKDLNAPVNALVDVVGWFASGQGGRYVPLDQVTRIADTATGTGGRQGALGQGETASFGVSGLAGVSPAATAAALTVTGSGDPQATQLSVTPHEVGFAPVTSIGAAEQQPTAGFVLPPLGPSGQLDIRNETGSARVQADVTGYFLGGQQVTGGAGNCVTPSGGTGYSSLFDGRVETGLEAWQVAGSNEIKQNGCELDTSTGNSDVTWYGAHTYSNNYTLELDWQATTANSASGVMLGFPNPQGNATVPSTDGLDVVIGPSGATGNQQTGSIAGLQAPSSSPVNPVGQWNTFQITVSWNTVTVALNGQQVNQYTTNDPARINVPSFIGLANSGSGDSVHFRDIRIKRNGPVGAGSLLGDGNLCLDLANGNPAPQTQVRLWQCNGQIAQDWQMTSDGRIQDAGACLDDAGGGTANGNQVWIFTCNGSMAQQWVMRSDRSIVNVLAKKCLTAPTATAGAVAQIDDCTGSANQIWNFQSAFTHGITSAYTTGGGTCLDVRNGTPANGTVVQAYQCLGNLNQQWTTPGDGTIQADSGCLDVQNGTAADGTPVQLYTCIPGDANQQWQAQPDGSLINPLTNRCLTVSSTSNTTPATISTCTGSALQRWLPTAQVAWSGQINGPAGKCIQVTNADPNTHAVTLWGCDASPGTNWTGAPNSGTVHTFGDCMDTNSGGTANNTVVTLWSCNGAVSQLWIPRPDGTVVNPKSDRVLDDQNGSTANGNTIQIYDNVETINGRINVNQRWALPVLAS